MAVDYDALLEKVAFGKATPKVSTCLGMYLSPDVIYISETHMDKGRTVVTHLVRVPVPAPEKKVATTGATLNIDFLADHEKLSALIRQAMSQIRWNTKDVILTLSHQLSLLRFFTMPKTERRYYDSAVPMEAKKYIPIPFDTIAYDYQIVPMTPGGDLRPRQGAMVAVTPNKNLPNIKALLAALDLNLLGIEVAPCSVLRAWNSAESGKAQDPFGQVHFDNGNIRIMVSDKGIPVFFREVFLGPDASVEDARKVDIAGCIGFAQKQLGVGKLTAMRVSGTAPDINKWQERFAHDLMMSVGFHDTAALLGIKAGDWGGYASIGSSLKYMKPDSMTLDLASLGKVAPADKFAAKNILMVGAVLTALLIFFGGIRNINYIRKIRQLKGLAPDPAVSASFDGLDAQTIEMKISSMEKQASALGAVNRHKDEYSYELLREIAQALPDRVWITTLDMANVMKDTKKGPTLRIAGYASAQDMASEQALAYQFRSNISNSKLLSRMYTDIQISVSGSPMDAAEFKGLEQAEMKRKLEARTQFTISGGKKLGR